MDAVEIMMQSKWAWFAEPLLRGDYPPLMREHYDMLPRFTAEEQQLLKGSIDFLAVNVYTSRYVQAGVQNDNVSAISVAAERSLFRGMHGQQHVTVHLAL
jgi:beta-glucosidase/6-phospho-beta-glucosidase/beta-galactosidase